MKSKKWMQKLNATILGPTPLNERGKAELDGGKPTIVDLGPCKTAVSFKAGASYPFGPFGVDRLKFLVPSVDYNVTFTFEVTAKNEVTVTLTGTHNRSPDYEGFADGSVFYKYKSPWQTPNSISMTAWSNIRSGAKLVIKNIDVPGCCPSPHKSY